MNSLGQCKYENMLLYKNIYCTVEYYILYYCRTIDDPSFKLYCILHDPHVEFYAEWQPCPEQEPLDPGDGGAPQQDHHTCRGVLGVSITLLSRLVSYLATQQDHHTSKEEFWE